MIHPVNKSFMQLCPPTVYRQGAITQGIVANRTPKYFAPVGIACQKFASSLSLQEHHQLLDILSLRT